MFVFDLFEKKSLDKSADPKVKQVGQQMAYKHPAAKTDIEALGAEVADQDAINKQQEKEINALQQQVGKGPAPAKAKTELPYNPDTGTPKAQAPASAPAAAAPAVPPTPTAPAPAKPATPKGGPVGMPDVPVGIPSAQAAPATAKRTAVAPVQTPAEVPATVAPDTATVPAKPSNVVFPNFGGQDKKQIKHVSPGLGSLFAQAPMAKAAESKIYEADDAGTQAFGQMAQQLSPGSHVGMDPLQVNVRAFAGALIHGQNYYLIFGPARVIVTPEDAVQINDFIQQFYPDHKKQEEVFTAILGSLNGYREMKQRVQEFNASVQPSLPGIEEPEGGPIEEGDVVPFPSNNNPYALAVQIVNSAYNPKVAHSQIDQMKQALLQDYGYRIRQAPNGGYYMINQQTGDKRMIPTPQATTEDSWHDGQDAWASEQDQWANEGRMNDLSLGYNRRANRVAGEEEPRGDFRVVRKRDGQWQLIKQHDSSNMAFKHAQNIKNKYPSMEVGVRWPNGTVNLVGLTRESSNDPVAQDSPSPIHGVSEGKDYWAKLKEERRRKANAVLNELQETVNKYEIK